MNTFEVIALERPVAATIEIPGSKSYTNRALVMAALTHGSVTLWNPLFSEDTEAMIGCLRLLGLKIETFTDKIVVHDDISIVEEKNYELFARDSGTTLRFLLPLLCLTPGTKKILGSKRLNERPIRGLIDALRSLGAEIEYLEKDGQPPLKIYPSTLAKAGQVTIDGSTSSQYVSALLLVAPLLNGLKIIISGNLISKPYVDMTIRQMQESGVDIFVGQDGSYEILSEQEYSKHTYNIEGDYSSAGYFFAIATLTESTLTLNNLNPNSLQADKQLLAILKEMGNIVIHNDCGITFIGKRIIPLSLDMEGCPDQVQTMAVLSAFANGVTKISGVRSLRVKETERVKALRAELSKMGIATEETHDTLTIYGGQPRPATIETYGDHRMAMAFAVAGKKLAGMKIVNPEVVCKSFPTFWETLKKI